MSLLPSTPEITDDSEPRVVGIEGEDADELLSALSSETARRIVAELHDEPAPPSDLADRVDSTLQNVQYHLSRLDDAGVVRVAGTAYSEKGREMDVYAPADQPLVIVAGDEGETSGLRAAISRLLGGTGALLVGSAAVQQLFGDGFLPVPVASTGSGGGDGGAVEQTTEQDSGAGAATETPTEAVADTLTETPAATGTPTPAAEATPTQTPLEVATSTPMSTEAASGGAFDAAGTLPPGLLFFLGGFVVLVTIVALSYGQTGV